jgi:hypothetical protein
MLFVRIELYRERRNIEAAVKSQVRVRKFNAFRFEALLDFLVEAVLEIKPVTLSGRIQENLPDAGQVFPLFGLRSPNDCSGGSHCDGHDLHSGFTGRRA